jgi:hypothetical protein
MSRWESAWWLWVIDLGSYLLVAVIPEFVVCGGCNNADDKADKETDPKAHGMPAVKTISKQCAAGNDLNSRYNYPSGGAHAPSQEDNQRPHMARASAAGKFA